MRLPEYSHTSDHTSRAQYYCWFIVLYHSLSEGLWLFLMHSSTHSHWKSLTDDNLMLLTTLRQLRKLSVSEVSLSEEAVVKFRAHYKNKIQVNVWADWTATQTLVFLLLYAITYMHVLNINFVYCDNYYWCLWDCFGKLYNWSSHFVSCSIHYTVPSTLSYDN